MFVVYGSKSILLSFSASSPAGMSAMFDWFYINYTERVNASTPWDFNIVFRNDLGTERRI